MPLPERERLFHATGENIAASARSVLSYIFPHFILYSNEDFIGLFSRIAGGKKQIVCLLENVNGIFLLNPCFNSAGKTTFSDFSVPPP